MDLSAGDHRDCSLMKKLHIARLPVRSEKCVTCCCKLGLRRWAEFLCKRWFLLSQERFRNLPPGKTSGTCSRSTLTKFFVYNCETFLVGSESLFHNSCQEDSKHLSCIQVTTFCSVSSGSCSHWKTFNSNLSLVFFCQRSCDNGNFSKKKKNKYPQPVVLTGSKTNFFGPQQLRKKQSQFCW